MTKNPPADHAPIASAEPIDRGALRAAFRQEEAACVADRLRETQVFSRDHAAIQAYAVKLIQDARKRDVSGIDAFLHQYGLNTEEGIALMCLAEALLRVPDGRTADALIRDKIGEINWREHLNESDSTFVNAATFSLMLTGEVLERPEQTQKAMGRTLRGAMNRLGEPVIRQATFQAMEVCLAAARDAAEVDTLVLELAGKKIGPCTACGICKEGLICGWDDDFGEIIPVLSDPRLAAGVASEKETGVGRE